MNFNHDWERFVDGRIREGTQNLYAESLAFVKEHLVSRVLQLSGGDVDRAAGTLGLGREEVDERAKKLSQS